MPLTTINFVLFNNNQLTSVAGVTVLSTNPYQPPKRGLALYNIARSNLSKVAGAFYTKRQITVRVGITGNTRTGAEQSLDNLMKLLQGQEKDLVMPQSGGVRRYTATLADTNIVRAGGGYTEMDLIFECSDRFGYDTAYTTIANLTGQTSSTRSHNYNFDGSAPFQVPFISIKPTALVLNGSNGTITIANANSGQSIAVTRIWVANDLLEIDCLNRTVKVNGVAVAYTGAFPEFPNGAGTLTYADNFTSRTVTTFAYYYKRWV